VQTVIFDKTGTLTSSIDCGAGTDVAVETADVRNNPRDVATIIELSKKTYVKMKQHLWWQIPLAAGVLLAPAAGAILMRSRGAESRIVMWKLSSS